jgi:RNA polymerase sigma-70 factor, ECF subfamily
MDSSQQQIRSLASDGTFGRSAPDCSRARGNREAFDAVADDLLVRVKKRVRGLVCRDADADDIAQEALVTIIAGLPSHRGDGPLVAWADRVTVRAVFAYLRRRKRTRLEIEADLSVVPAPGSAPDESLDQRAAVRLLDAIPHSQRRALVLHHVVGMSVPEVAEATGSPVETVRSRLRLGMGRLRGLHASERSATSDALEAVMVP